MVRGDPCGCHHHDRDEEPQIPQITQISHRRLEKLFDPRREDFEQKAAKVRNFLSNSSLCDLLFDLNSRTTRTMISGPKNKSPLPVREGVIELNGVPK
jgi:hypothetical protein